MLRAPERPPQVAIPCTHMPSSPDGRLVCRLDGHSYPVGIFPLIIGRAPECAIVVTEDEVSRQHACVMRTPAGYVVVDTSTHGTFVNGEPVAAQRLLRSGDVIEIGPRVFEFVLPHEPAPADAQGTAEPALTPAATRPYRRSRATGKTVLLHQLPDNRSRWQEWIRRYGLAEIAGTAAAIGGYWAGFALTGSRVAAAYAAALSESAGFYAILILRDMVRDAYAAGSRRGRYGPREMGQTCRNLFVEFGPTELLDNLLIRPLCMGLGGRLLGPRLGIIAGKLAADVFFYGLPILTTEWRRRISISGN